MKILVPIDVTHKNEGLVQQMSRILPLSDADVRLLFVREELPSYESMLSSMADFPEDWSNQIEKKAHSVLYEIKNELKPLCKSVDAEIVSGPTALMIETVAKDDNFDITAITPQQHSKLHQLFARSVSLNVAKHGTGTIVLLHEARHHSGPLRVVIGVDGSNASTNALEMATKNFALEKASVHLVNVVTIAPILTLVSPVTFIGALQEKLMLEGETFLATAKNHLDKLGVKNVEISLKSGDPATELNSVANHIEADLIVVGALGHGAVQHFLLGSVSKAVALHATCSVAVVREPQAKH